MQAKIAFSAALLAAAFAGNALAESPNAGGAPAFTSSQSRDAVLAELAAYKRAGVNPWSMSYNPLRSFQSATTRDAVVADYLASRGEVRALTGEDSGSMYLATMRTRAVPRDTLAGQPASAQ